MAKTQHLGGRPAFADHLLRLWFAQTGQVFRKQRRADAPQAVGAVAGSTVLLVIGLGIGRLG